MRDRPRTHLPTTGKQVPMHPLALPVGNIITHHIIELRAWEPGSLRNNSLSVRATHTLLFVQRAWGFFLVFEITTG